MISFLKARDPSILAWNACPAAKKNLEEDLYEESVAVPKPPAQESLEVFLRVKKVPEKYDHLYEVHEKELTCKIPPGSYSRRNARDNDVVKGKYKFSKIFPDTTSQIQIFNEVIKPRMLDFVNGHNCSLLTYGASGSGKTYTILGTDDQPGIIPRALEYLFRTVPELGNTPKLKPHPSGNVTFLTSSEQSQEREIKHKILNAASILGEKNVFTKIYKSMQKNIMNETFAEIEQLPSNVSIAIWVSFAEIYNEYVYDLLQVEPLKGQQRRKLKILNNSIGTTYIKDLTSINVTTGLEAFLILQYGLQYLQYAATSVNSHSSRSHCIFSLKLAQLSDDGKMSKMSCFNFCDLAGSERVKKTLNKGDRLKESNNINTSLMVLHKCIMNIRDSQRLHDNRLIPFRESKLTQLLRRALSGVENICLIVNINPVLNMIDESMHVLNFSAIAKQIVVEPVQEFLPPPPLPKKDRFTTVQARSTTFLHNDDEKQELLKIIAELKDELEQEQLKCQEIEETTRQAICNEYKEAFNRIRQIYRSNCETEKSIFRKQMQDQLISFKEKFIQDQQQLPKKRKLNESVIVLDDSDNTLDDSIIELENSFSEVEAISSKIENKILEERQLRNSLEIRDEYLRQATADIKSLKEENYLLAERNDLLEQQLETVMKELREVKARNEELEENQVDYNEKVNTTNTCDEFSQENKNTSSFMSIQKLFDRN